MGVITAPVPASGSCPAWIARVANPPWWWSPRWSPCCCSLMPARLTARRRLSPGSRGWRLGREHLHGITDAYGARLQDAEDRPTAGVQRSHRARPDVVVHEAAGGGEPHDLQQDVADA